MVTSTYAEAIQPGTPNIRLWAVLQCQGCLKFICSGVERPSVDVPGGNIYKYHAHYPLGKPDDSVATEIPADISNDFKEALRCRWVEAYNATAEMCRRAIQSSCDDLKARGDNLFEQIDDLAAKGIITNPLKEMAHKVRLGGNRGAHPSAHKITATEADAVIAFMKHYFEHVYVMPAALAKFDFSKPSVATPPSGGKV